MPVNNCCCGPTTYRQARRCHDNTLVDVWMTVLDAALTGGSFLVSLTNSLCLRFDPLDPTYSTPGGPVYPLSAAVLFTSCISCMPGTGGGHPTGCSCGCGTFLLTFYRYNDTAGLILDGGSGLYYLGTGPALSLQLTSNDCSHISVVGTAWVFDLGVGYPALISYGTHCPPTGTEGWEIDPSGDPGEVLYVECEDTTTPCPDLPDILYLDGVIEVIQTNWADDAMAPVFDGVLERVGDPDGCNYAPQVGNPCRVKQADGTTYAAIYIYVENPGGVPASVSLSPSGAHIGSYGLQINNSVLGEYFLSENAFSVPDFDTLNVLLPRSVTVTV